jgi:hypothetical protein
MDVQNLIHPRMLRDDNVYLAFYPRKGWDSGALFSTLRRTNLPDLIIQSPHSPGFMLSKEVIRSWRELEIFLYDIATYLYSEYPDRKFIPDLVYPGRPSDCGYRSAHKSIRDTLQAVNRSLEAFRMLSSFVSFALALWISDDEETCFDRPFLKLMNRTPNGIPPIQLDNLRESTVCKIMPGLRPGGFLNPYVTKWGRVFFRFCRFCVPTWLIWGHENMYNEFRCMDAYMMRECFPPPKKMATVKEQQLTFSWLVLPDSNGFAEAPNRADLTPAPTDSLSEYPLPDYAILEDAGPPPASNPQDSGQAWEAPGEPEGMVDRRLVVDTYGSAQRPSETWDSFRARMEEALEKRKKVESAKERQSRESLEKNARQKGYSKKTTVFLWESDDVHQGFYRRTKVDRIHASSEWNSCTEHQRFFWSHRKEWDLVPHLPRFPPGVRGETPVEDLEFDDPRYNFLYSRPPLSRPTDGHDADDVPQTTGEYVFHFPTLVEYLKSRHGFSTSLIDNWHPECQDPSLAKKLYLSRDRSKVALRRLGYGEEAGQELPTAEAELVSVINFENICVAVASKKTRVSNLPLTWDLSSNSWSASPLRVQIVKYELADGGDLFVIRQRNPSFDDSSWYVATPSSTAVLFAIRRGWGTMREIAGAFLDLGIPFHTVEERMKEDIPLPPHRYRPLGLNVRPRGFIPGVADYDAYVRARDEVFKSARARALRLRGGIIGRLALECVPDVVVLDGPSFCDEVVGTLDNSSFLDDYISMNDLEIVSGVYRVSLSEREEDFAHHSWWPKHGTWQKTGFLGDQWLPNAERFYVQRRKKLERGEFDVKGATAWKESLKYDRTQMEFIYGGSEALAKEVIRLHLT